MNKIVVKTLNHIFNFTFSILHFQFYIFNYSIHKPNQPFIQNFTAIVNSDVFSLQTDTL